MKTFTIIAVVLLLLVGGYFLVRKSYQQPVKTDQSIAVPVDFVAINNFAFNPNNIQIEAGTTVTFVNNDSVDHTVTADNGKFNQSVAAGQRTSFVISELGTYSYHCQIHPNMKGTIIVK